jgi:hypothetical protein
MHSRLQRIESGQEVTLTWGGEVMATPNTNSAAILSTSFLIPSGAYRGIVFAEDRSRGAAPSANHPIFVVN